MAGKKRLVIVLIRAMIAMVILSVAIFSIALLYPPATAALADGIAMVVITRDALRSRDSSCGIRDIPDALATFRTRTALLSRVRLVRTDPEGFDLDNTPVGQLWSPSRNRTHLAGVVAEIVSGLYDHPKVRPRSGDIVLDCGANIGVYTRHALNSGARLVVAIDIEPDNLKCLRRTFAREIAEGKVIVHDRGVWDKDAVLPLFEADDTIGSSVVAVGDRKATRTAALTTIDKIVTELSLPRVDVIKLDIEGAEKQALAGARQTVARYKPRLAVALEHASADLSAVPAQVHQDWPFMATQPGPCEWVTGYDKAQLQPHVMFVYP